MIRIRRGDTAKGEALARRLAKLAGAEGVARPSRELATDWLGSASTPKGRGSAQRQGGVAPDELRGSGGWSPKVSRYPK